MSEQLPNESEPETSAPEPASPPAKMGFASKLKALFRFRIRLQIVDRTKPTANAPEKAEEVSETALEDVLEAGAVAEEVSEATLEDVLEAGAQEAAPVKAKKLTLPKLPKLALPKLSLLGNKKAKAPKTKEAKAPKIKKAKAPKKAKPTPAVKASKDGKAKKKPSPVILIIVGAVVLGGAGFGIFSAINARNSPQKQLLKAQQYTADGDYEDAADIYNKLIEEQLVVPEAYLGLADTLLETQDKPGAIAKLEDGLAETGDERIAQKLEELKPQATEEGTPLSLAESPRPNDEVIVWADSAFEKMIRMALEKPFPEDIRVSDVAGIRTLKILGETHAVTNDVLASFSTRNGYTVNGVDYTEYGSIASLADLGHFKSLTKLTVAYNSVSSLNGLESLSSLQTLGLYANKIENIEVLGKLPGLKYLYLYNNSIRDISPLKELPKLHDLWLQYNQLTDISAVAGLVELSELLVGYNQITDIGVISTLPNLHFFFAEYNNITNISAAAEAQALTDISFVGNAVTDFSPVKHVQNVNKPFGRTTVPR